MKGYYKQADKTRDLFWHDEEGRLFFKSGDMGRIDEDGFVVLLDRKKDMIISGGFNVYAADIEVLLLKHPDVDRRRGDRHPERAVGRIADGAVRAGATAPRSARPRCSDWANGQLSKTQRLVAVEFRESLPRSTIGKIMKRELREPYWAGRSAKDLRDTMTDPTLRSTHLFTLPPDGRSEHDRRRRDALWPPPHRHGHRRHLRGRGDPGHGAAGAGRRLAAAAARRHPDAERSAHAQDRRRPSDLHALSRACGTARPG